MAGVDYKTAPLVLREKIAFGIAEVQRLTRKITEYDNILGCVIVSTCNRTEIYISSVTPHEDAAKLLFEACGADYDEFKDCITERFDRDAVRHLAEVACGLHSAIVCEEQIVTQVGEAVELSREAESCDAVLNTAFRCAVTAGKRSLTEFCVQNVPLSSAHAAVNTAEKLYGCLKGKKALIIGNGKVGLLAAQELLKKGCSVCITLRRYKHGDNIIPKGADTVDFCNRVSAYEKCDFVISATRSPHYTISLSGIESCQKHPDYIFDLAVPRDVEPGVERYVRCCNVDELAEGDTVDENVIEAICDIAERYTNEFMRWCQFKEGI